VKTLFLSGNTKYTTALLQKMTNELTRYYFASQVGAVEQAELIESSRSSIHDLQHGQSLLVEPFRDTSHAKGAFSDSDGW